MRSTGANLDYLAAACRDLAVDICASEPRNDAQLAARLLVLASELLSEARRLLSDEAHVSDESASATR